uniref:Uncharacterized protein n=1 Tax=Salix viminalis TaxID=40686 RepID=A0A6N2N7R5_SALVM
MFSNPISAQRHHQDACWWTAVAQDDISGDGTTSTIAKRATLHLLENFKTPVVMGDEPDREILKMVARTTIRTKLYEALADQLTDIVVNSVSALYSKAEKH